MKKIAKFLLLSIALLLTSTAFAFDDAGNARTLGDVSNVATGLIFMTTNLMSVCFFFLGMGFTVGAVLRYRAHFKNPTAMPLMTPILMSFFAIIMFCFNAFNTWKQNEVFRGGKAPVLHVSVPQYNPNGQNQAQMQQQKTPIQVLREMEQAQKNPQGYQQPQQNPQGYQQPQQQVQPTYQPPAGQVVNPAMPPQPYDPDFDDDDDEEYAT